LLLALGLALGTAMSVNLPSWQAMVPDLVPNHHVASAVALNSASANVARAVGPALGGAIVAVAGPGPAFLANAVSYLAIMAALGSLTRRRLPEQPEAMGSAIALGLRYARFVRAYRWLLLVAGSFALTSAVVQAVLPTFTAQVLRGGAETYGLLLGMMGAERCSGRSAVRARPAASAAGWSPARSRCLGWPGSRSGWLVTRSSPRLRC
jgi:predicted MFS family arabinose efflux permease